MRLDPVERTTKYRRAVGKADELALAEIIAAGFNPNGMGACHAFWGAKKTILLERFGIEWRSPSEMNPHVCFD